MSKETSTAPTDDAVRAAELVIQKHREAQAAARRDVMAPLLTLLQSSEFTDAVAQVQSLADPSLDAHLRALQAGADQLVRVGVRDVASVA